LTTIVVSTAAPRDRVERLASRVRVLEGPPDSEGRVDRRWLVENLGAEQVTHLLVEGGGEVNASFLSAALVQRVAFFYAPMILGGANARKAVAGTGATRPGEELDLVDVRWRRIGQDILLTARIKQTCS